jgi:hypothetical protein
MESIFVFSPNLARAFSSSLGVPFCLPAATALMRSFNGCMLLLQYDPAFDNSCVGTLLAGSCFSGIQAFGHCPARQPAAAAAAVADAAAAATRPRFSRLSTFESRDTHRWDGEPERVVSLWPLGMYPGTAVLRLPARMFFVVAPPRTTHENILTAPLAGAAARGPPAATFHNDAEAPDPMEHDTLPDINDSGTYAYMYASRKADGDDNYRESPRYSTAPAPPLAVPSISWADFVARAQQHVQQVRVAWLQLIRYQIDNSTLACTTLHNLFFLLICSTHACG